MLVGGEVFEVFCRKLKGRGITPIRHKQIATLRQLAWQVTDDRSVLLVLVEAARGTGGRNRGLLCLVGIVTAGRAEHTAERSFVRSNSHGGLSQRR
jgi:hypothetical protein